MEREITIGEQRIRFRVTALVPRLYRHQFGRDLIVDMNKLAKTLGENGEMSDEAFEIFENVAYTMAKHADAAIPATVESWLSSFEDLLAFYNSLPEIMELWASNLSTTSTPKKK